MWRLAQFCLLGFDTIEKSELYRGQKVVYHTPFEKCDRVQDYETAWEWFEQL